jgi:hypothetical protein
MVQQSIENFSLFSCNAMLAIESKLTFSGTVASIFSVKKISKT